MLLRNRIDICELERHSMWLGGTEAPGRRSAEMLVGTTLLPRKQPTQDGQFL